MRGKLGNGDQFNSLVWGQHFSTWCVRRYSTQNQIGRSWYVGTWICGTGDWGAGGGTGGSKCGLGSLLSHPLSFTPGRESFDRDSGSLVDIR